MQCFLEEIMKIENPNENIMARFNTNCLSSLGSLDRARAIIDQGLNKDFFTKINDIIRVCRVEEVEETDEKNNVCSRDSLNIVGHSDAVKLWYKEDIRLSAREQPGEVLDQFKFPIGVCRIKLSGMPSFHSVVQRSDFVQYSFPGAHKSGVYKLGKGRSTLPHA